VIRVLIASGNRGKVREFQEMLRDHGVECTDLSAHPNAIAPEETGHTFRANAMLKAMHYATSLRTWALADDSGLSVDVLGGKPGVHSARWAELGNAGKGDADNNALLLQQLDAVPSDQRAARFVCCLALSDPQGRVILRVSDTGPGIPPGILPRLFEPFVTSKPAGTGLGLGLVISAQLVRAMDGSLRAANLPEGGACFVVDLPAALHKTPQE